MIKLFKDKFYVTKTNIFLNFSIFHLTLEALLITWGRLQNDTEYTPVFEAQ